ncbi:MAG: DUF1566 domain-containing protein [Candidatus Electrothrix sp. EH2]|nr:DUF1566 domain-containing protein [Candidatus Electrothrix sp. EH2]
MKKQYIAVLPLASLLLASNGFFQPVHSFDLVLMMPPILAAQQQGTVIGWQPLNDTGITWSGNYASDNNTACVASTTPDGDNVVAAQDCSHGRDVTHNDDSDGHAGFSYTKLDSSGQPLADQTATQWACVKDNVTGLIWEMKTDDGGLHDKDDTYTWYNTNAATNGGAAGVDGAANNTCSGWTSGNAATYCNTQAYVNRMNAAGLCGANDWRMPTVKELESILNYGRVNPSIDSGYFPNTAGEWYWSGTPQSRYYVWGVHFDIGFPNYHQHDPSFAVRLVRSGQ